MKFQLYDDRFDGKSIDEGIQEILGEKTDRTDNAKLKRILMKVIKNELTEKQRYVVMMYYFKKMTLQEIAGKLGVTHQTVADALIRAKSRIFRILKYYFD